MALVELSVMEQRYEAVLAVIQGGWKITEVAERLGVTRQTIRNWIVRDEKQGGLPALADRSHRPRTSCSAPPPDAPPPPAEISFVCTPTPTSTVTGTVNVRMGVGFVSQRTKNLKFGTASVSGTVEYQMTDPDVPTGQKTQFDLEYGVCAYTTYRMLSLPGFPGNCASAPTDAWVWSACPACEHPAVTESMQMRFDPLGNTLPVSEDKLPFGFMHHRISLPRPNYFAHLDLSYGYTVTNTLVAIVARAGQDTRVAIPSFSGYSSSAGVPVYAWGWPMDPLDNLEAEIKACTSSCTSATVTSGRASVSFDFPKALNADHADLYFLAIPTSWTDPATFRIDTPGYAVRTSDKPKLCKPIYCFNQDGFVTMTMADGSHLPPDAEHPATHPDSTDTLRLQFQSSIATQDAYPADWVCRPQFGCDDMFVSFGIPKGAPTGTAQQDCSTYSRLQDVVERRSSTISFLCSDTPTSTVTGTVNVRMGVGFVSQRTKNLQFGTASVSGTVEYQMTDPEVPTGQKTPVRLEDQQLKSFYDENDGLASTRRPPHRV